MIVMKTLEYIQLFLTDLCMTSNCSKVMVLGVFTTASEQWSVAKTAKKGFRVTVIDLFRRVMSVHEIKGDNGQ